MADDTSEPKAASDTESSSSEPAQTTATRAVVPTAQVRDARVGFYAKGFGS